MDSCIHNDINMSLIVCKEFDVNTKSIHEIFDKVKVSNETKIDMDLIIICEIRTEKKYECTAYIDYLLNEKGEDPKMRLKLIDFDIPPNDDLITKKGDKLNSCNEFYSNVNKSSTLGGYALKNVPVLGKGHYEVVVYVKEKETDNKRKRISAFSFELN